MRQLSIAAITLSWPRLTWPALALRQAGPRSRKISATSAGRGTRAYAGGRLVLLDLADEMIERAGDVADRSGGNLRVARRRVELGMSEQHLDHANIDVLLQ